MLHLLRNTFCYAARRDWEQIGRDLKPVYSAVNEADAKEQFSEFARKWRGKSPAAPHRQPPNLSAARTPCDLAGVRAERRCR